MMEFLVAYAGGMLAEGGEISTTVDRELAVTLRLFEQGGGAALNGMMAQDYDVLARRPSVSKGTKVKLLAGALAGKAFGVLARRTPR